MPISIINSKKVLLVFSLTIFSILFLILNLNYVICVSTVKYAESGTVTYVVDGDTFDVSGVGRVRLADINCPEMDTQAGINAKNYVYNLINQEFVYLDIDDKYITGYYGRYIAVCYVPYNSTHYVHLNQLLLKQGYAVISDYDNEFNPYPWSSGSQIYVSKTVILGDNSGNSGTEPDGEDDPFNPYNDNEPDSPIPYILASIISLILIIGLSYILIHKAPKASRYSETEIYKDNYYGSKIENQKSQNQINQKTLEPYIIVSNNPITKNNISSLLNWTEWVDIYDENSDGDIQARFADANENFWKIWRENKGEIRNLGFSVYLIEENWVIKQIKNKNDLKL